MYKIYLKKVYLAFYRLTDQEYKENKDYIKLGTPIQKHVVYLQVTYMSIRVDSNLQNVFSELILKAHVSDIVLPLKNYIKNKIFID